MLPPTKYDLQNIGNMSAFNFRRDYGPNTATEVGRIIPETGYMKVNENGKDFIVMAYPDEFMESIAVIADKFYKQKRINEEKAAGKAETTSSKSWPAVDTSTSAAMLSTQIDGKKKERKKIPANKPVFSSKSAK